MLSSQIIIIIKLFLLALLVAVLFTEACPQLDQDKMNKESWGMPGGFSSPHEATSEEVSILHKVWSETANKCAHLPKEMDKVKICSVRKQVVAGMNYEYTLSDSTGRTFKAVVYVPLGNEAERLQQVTMCESEGSPSAVEAS